MKKLVLVALLLCLCMCSAASAQVKGWEWDASVSGDTQWLSDVNKLTVGIGLNLVSFKDGLLGLRVEAIKEPTSDNVTRGGAGLSVNLPKLFNLMGGNWVAENINPSVFALVCYNTDPGAVSKPWSFSIGAIIITIPF